MSTIKDGGTNFVTNCGMMEKRVLDHIDQGSNLRNAVGKYCSVRLGQGGTCYPTWHKNGGVRNDVSSVWIGTWGKYCCVR